ncbi:MAG TPA: phospholipase D-like domain-containing protein [Gemmatimonadales bacterium]
MIPILLSVVATLLVVTLLRNLLPAGSAPTYQMSTTSTVGSPQFIRDMGNLLGPGFAGANRVDTFTNGDEIFPAMLDAIHGAQRSINLETYLYWSGGIGERFAQALAERARAGVAVRLLLDWAGAFRANRSLLRRLKQSGVHVQHYRPLRLFLLHMINNRTHRKLLIIDGKIGFTGGVGFADKWSGHAQDRHHWRDNHYRLEGPAVSQMQSAFLDNWIQTSGEVLHGEAYFPQLTPVGEARAQVFKSSARQGSESMRLMYLMSFAAARRSIRIENSYFVPDDQTVRELVRARERGVEVEIIVPGRFIDVPLVRIASRSRWGPMLRAGIRIYEFQPTMLHCKVLVVDDCWASVGSTNIDNRSFRLNDEANLNVLDDDFAARQNQLFEADRARSREVVLHRWRARRRVWQESLAALVRSQL